MLVVVEVKKMFILKLVRKMIIVFISCGFCKLENIICLLVGF